MGERSETHIRRWRLIRSVGITVCRIWPLKRVQPCESIRWQRWLATVAFARCISFACGPKPQKYDDEDDQQSADQSRMHAPAVRYIVKKTVLQAKNIASMGRLNASRVDSASNKDGWRQKLRKRRPRTTPFCRSRHQQPNGNDDNDDSECVHRQFVLLMAKKYVIGGHYRFKSLARPE